MGIIDRFTTIVKANVNDLLDRAEDPAKTADQLVLDMTENIAEVRRQTASVMAQEKRARREVEECEGEIERMGRCAKKAVAAGNDDDARTFIERKQDLEAKLTDLKRSYEVAHASSEKLQGVHDELVEKLRELRDRREAIKSKMAVADAQKKAAGYTSNSKKAESALEAFDRMEDKAEAALAESESMMELADVDVDGFGDLADKYEAGGSASVEDELAALKAEMGDAE